MPKVQNSSELLLKAAVAQSMPQKYYRNYFVVVKQDVCADNNVEWMTGMWGAKSCPRCCSSPTTCTRLAGQMLTSWGWSTRFATLTIVQSPHDYNLTIVQSPHDYNRHNLCKLINQVRHISTLTIVQSHQHYNRHNNSIFVIRIIIFTLCAGGSSPRRLHVSGGDQPPLPRLLSSSSSSLFITLSKQLAVSSLSWCFLSKS